MTLDFKHHCMTKQGMTLSMKALSYSIVQAHFRGIPSKSFPKSPAGPFGKADLLGVGTGTVLWSRAQIAPSMQG